LSRKEEGRRKKEEGRGKRESAFAGRGKIHQN